MIEETSDYEQVAREGELLAPKMTVTWISPGRIEAGELIAPVKLSTAKAESFAAMHLILGDLMFALDCLAQADQIGMPDATNIQSKGLVFSAVVAYARPFKSGVRQIRLSPEQLVEKNVSFDSDIHDYLIALRDKHVAHSVNDCEYCEAIAVLVGKPELGWRDGSGVGVIIKQSVGLTRKLLKRTMVHIENLKIAISGEIEALRLEVYEEFKADFAQDSNREMVPLVKLSDRSKVSERRK